MRSPGSSEVTDVPERFVPASMHGELVEAEHLVRYWWAAGLAAGRRVLDAGCGVGYGTDILLKAGARSATGCDIAQEVIEAAQDAAPDGATFVPGDLHALPFGDDSFDLVVCFEAIEHVRDAVTAFGELCRVLAPGGLLVVSSPNPAAYVEGNPHHVHEFTPDELAELAGRHFDNSTVRYQHNWIASALLDRDTVDRSGLDGVAVELAKVAASTDQAAPYSLVLASDEPLPAAGDRAVATGLAEVRRWVELYAGQQHVLSEQHAWMRERDSHDDELRELHRELMNSELELADARNREADALSREAARYAQVVLLDERLQRAERIMQQMQASPSWRVTQPLRALKRILS